MQVVGAGLVHLRRDGERLAFAVPPLLRSGVASAEAVLALKPAGAHHRQIDIGVVGPHPEGGEVAWEIRTFFTDHLGTIREDPLTGSFNASAAQGTRLGRAGRIYIDQDETGQVWIGGRSRTLFEGVTR